jgi:hypothetical protein
MISNDLMALKVKMNSFLVKYPSSDIPTIINPRHYLLINYLNQIGSTEISTKNINNKQKFNYLGILDPI